MRAWILPFVIATAACPAVAQIDSEPGTADWRHQTFTYLPDAIYRLDVEAGHHITVAFAAGAVTTDFGTNSALSRRSKLKSWPVSPTQYPMIASSQISAPSSALA